MFDVEFSEPHFDPRSFQYLIVGTLRLEVEGRQHRVLRSKLWLTIEARQNERWYQQALRTIREELEQRAQREIAAALRYRPDPEPATFTRISIPLVRRIYPQLIANDIVNVQPMMNSNVADIYANWNHAGGTRWRYRRPEKIEVDWKKEGF